MIQGQDYETLATMLGTHDFPPELVEEHNVRALMLHKVGGGSSLGYVGLVDLCRHCGLGPKKDGSGDRVQWSNIPDNTRVRILRPSGEPLEGMYRGTVSAGIAAVKLDGMEHVNEFPIRNLEVVKGSLTTPEEAKRQSQVSASDKPTPLAQHLLDQEAQASLMSGEWSKTAPGTPVLVAAGDDTISGEFEAIDFDRAGCLTIRFGGRTHTVAVEDVVLASEVLAE